MTQVFDRLIALEGAYNVRDLGGYTTSGSGVTRWRSLLRGDALHQLSEADIDTLLKAGLTTIVDLRSAREIALEDSPFGAHATIRFHNMSLFDALAPIEIASGADGQAFDMAARYRDALDGCQPAIASVMRAIAEAPDGIVLFHCSAGKDRTGVIAAILLALADVDEETIISDYALTATISGPLIGKLREKALQRGTDPDLVERFLACAPETMRATLDHLRLRYGGPAEYLAALGLSEVDISRLLQRLV